MTLRDRDLMSIQEARELAGRAAEAQKRFAAFTQEQVDTVVEACAAAALDASEQLARLAVEETGYGNVPDKMTKNRLAAVHVTRAIRGLKTVGIVREDRERGIAEVATPVGVVAAIIPCTNPTSTAIYKTLISIKARNAVVLSPHPSAVKCIRATSEVLERAALKTGAPEGLISCMMHSTMQGTQELWRQREVGVILATGGAGLVRAAYSSGKPAYGVGPGNVPAYIERTANVPKAVADILAGKTFDYGTICSSEQAIICEQPVCEQAMEELRRQGAYILNAEESARVGALVFRPGTHTPNPQIVGKPAVMIAEMAGLRVPAATRALVARLEGVGRDHLLSAEKLSPILAFYSVPNSAAAFELCARLLHFGGAGHTAAVHTQDENTAKAFGQAVPAFRIVVNSSAVHGSIGYSTNLFPAMTLGCGAPGGNITSDNIGPQHLMNLKRIAWESRGVEHRTVPADRRLMAEHAPAPAASPSAAIAPTAQPAAAVESGKSSPAPALDRGTIAQAVAQVMQQLGIPRGAGTAPSPDPVTASVIASPAAEIVSRVFGAGKKAENPAPAAEVPAAAEPPRAPAEAPAAVKTPAAEIRVAEFVAESDVRAAIRNNAKIYVGPRSIVTPAARDLASSHDVLIETRNS